MRKLLSRTGVMLALLFIGIVQPGESFAGSKEPNESAGSPTEAVARAPESSRTRMVIVPPVIGKPFIAASTDINNVGLTPVIRPVVNPQHAPGSVTAQDPAAGTRLTPRTQVVLDVAQTEIAIQPGTTADEATGQTQVWGQLIVHRAFNIELKAQTQHVPLLAVAYQGRDYVRGDEPEPLRFAEARTRAIAERLSIAWTLLDMGGTLGISTDESIPLDDTSIWHLTDPIGPQYGQPGPHFPALYVCHPALGGSLLKIMTVYPEDAAAFGQPDDTHGIPTPLTPRELADYLVALLKAHHLLFHRQSADPNSYDQLDICKTREGRVFKEIAMQARHGASDMDTRDLKNVLEQMPLSQRARLATLAYKAPVDWRLRNKP